MKIFLKESLATLEKKFPNISKSNLKHIWRTDPSGNNHWSKKIAQFYSEGVVELDPILITIERYQNLIQRAKGARIPVKDINSFSTYSTFDNYVNQLEGQVKKRIERFKKKQNYEIVYEDSDWYVLYPEDYDTLATLSKDSDWCVAKSKSTYDSYKKDGEFLIIIGKYLFNLYKKEPIPKEERNSYYKWLFYGTPILVTINNKQKLTLNKKELANLRNEHEEYEEIDKMILKVDLTKVLRIDKNKLNKFYYNSRRELSKKDGPARIWPNGTKEWYQNGELHRDDGPAIEYASGNKEWYKNGKRHRENGPAIIYSDGQEEWYKDGKLHREDGPAIQWADGQKYWYQNGKQHREDGPAVEYPNGTKQWYMNGDLSREDGPARIWPNGTKEWYQSGKKHRENGPAIIYPDGTKEWWIDGKLIGADSK